MMKSHNKPTAFNDNIYLNSLMIKMDGKFHRKYELDYHNEYNMGTLSSISEFYPGKNGEHTLRNIFSDAEDLTEEHLFSFLIPSNGNVDIVCYYSSHYQQIHEIPTITKDDLNNNVWSFHAVDFSGMGSIGLPGQYFYNWFKNQACLNFHRVIPELLSTLVIILMQYHNTLYQLMTEINMYLTTYAHYNTMDRYYIKNNKSNPII